MRMKKLKEQFQTLFPRNVVVAEGQARACKHYRIKASSLGLVMMFEVFVGDEKEPCFGG